MAKVAEKPKFPQCERLVEIRERAGLTQEEMADKLGVSRDRYAKWETRSRIPVEYAVKVADIFKADVTGLLTGHPVKEILPSLSQTPVPGFLGTVPVEVVGAVQAGLFKRSTEWPPGDRETLAMPVNVPYSDKPLQALKVVGPSMDMWYPDGSYVVVLPSIYLGEGWIPTTGQHVVVTRTAWDEHEATIKEVAYDGDDLLLYPRSHHPDFQNPWRIPIRRHGIAPADGYEGMRISGLVVWAMRRAPGT